MEDRVRLVRPNPADAVQGRLRELNNLAIPFARLETIEPIILDGTSTVYPLPNGTVLPLSEGSAVRLTGSGQQWVVPIADGDRVAQLVRERVRTRTSSEVSAPTAEQWQAAMRKRELIRKSGTGKGSGAPSYYRFGFILFTVLAVASFAANEGGWAKSRARWCSGSAWWDV